MRDPECRLKRRYRDTALVTSSLAHIAHAKAANKLLDHKSANQRMRHSEKSGHLDRDLRSYCCIHIPKTESLRREVSVPKYVL